jgi:hypothetical protein
MVTGSHPILPLDIEEATWLVELPGRVLTTAEVIGYRAQALAKHFTHVEQMCQRVTAEKRAAVKRYEEVHKHTIKDYDFLPGDLVLVRNTVVEKSLNTKMATHYFGPVIVIRRTKGGSYIVAEMDGSVFQSKIAQFRVVPLEQRKSIQLPDNIHDLIDLSAETLAELIMDEGQDLYQGRDYQFGNVRLNSNEEYVEPESESDEPDLLNEEAESEEEEGPCRLITRFRARRKYQG